MFKNLVSVILPLTLMVGCAQGSFFAVEGAPEQQSRNGFAKDSMFQSNPSGMKQFSISQQMAGKNVTHYVQSIMQDMVANIKHVNEKTPIAVTSFVFLDKDFNQASLLGNQLAESFIHELHTFGIPVVDFKTTDYIRVTPEGDFVFSRDFLELSDDHPFLYVLGGTLVNHQGGVMVNARIVGLRSKSVVGTAQGFLPQNIVNALEDGAAYDGILLEQAN
ncbi:MULTISPECIES: FlgO family outer membrane protein [unclassified Pseudoalteromonas]|uniref:FlgO family outer membrane protein n=1 Tax=unclassified Pseudoalteromonas TaxID=194690 RepID=UPI0030141FE6